MDAIRNRFPRQERRQTAGGAAAYDPDARMRSASPESVWAGPRETMGPGLDHGRIPVPTVSSCCERREVREGERHPFGSSSVSALGHYYYYSSTLVATSRRWNGSLDMNDGGEG